MVACRICQYDNNEDRKFCSRCHYPLADFLQNLRVLVEQREDWEKKVWEQNEQLREILFNLKALQTDKYDYSHLRDLLHQKKWKEADKETANAIKKLMGVDDVDDKERNLLSLENITKLSGNDLRIINDLWISSSNNRYGFSVQTEIFQRVGDDVEKFVIQVGWKYYESGDQLKFCRYDELKFDKTPNETPTGYLPNMHEPLNQPIYPQRKNLFKHFKECNL